MLLVGNRDLGESGDFSEKSTEDMQQQQQQQGGVGGGGPPFGAPAAEIAPFPSSSSGTHVLGFSTPDFHHHHNLPPEAASPISSRPPALSQHQSFEELVPDEQALAAGEGSAPGNRWPRQETLALLKIRSEMDGAFRDATLKGPLWDDVSRKLAELGYTRSAKKCKEKFENVHKYYKRTKEGRAGRQDGKAYRFFNQLEALGGATTITMPDPATTTTAAATISASTLLAISGTSTAGPSCSAGVQTVQPPAFFIPPRPPAPAPDVAPIPGLSSLGFSSDTFSTSSYDSDDEGTEEVAASVAEGRKRKRAVGSGGSRKMMSFFEGMMKQVIERQEAMQQRFLETIEKREQDRMIREEAWKRQEMARLNREHELLAQERAMAASRDAAIISFLQKMSGGQTIQPPPAVTVTVPAAPPPPVTPNPPPPQTQPPPQPKTEQYCPKSQPSSPLPTPPPPPPPPQQQHQTSQQQELPCLHHNQSTENIRQQQQTPPPPALTKPPQASSTAPVPVTEPHEVVGGGGTSEGPSVSSSRWPKSEVHALIKLRSGLESRYQEAGPKGPLWEEISAGMQRLGYNRSSKRCKEKWENINKYFKKVKESNKKRPEDAKTCPYFHQLDALYRKKIAVNPIPQERTDAPAPSSSVATQLAPPQPPPESNSAIQIPTSNGGLPPTFLDQGACSGSGAATVKTPEDIMKELMEQQQQQQQQLPSIDDYDSDNNLDQEDDDEDEDEDGKMQYEIQFQRQNASDGRVGATTKAASSYMAMVQ